MTNPSIAAIQDARALLDTLLGNDWQEVHVVNGDTEIFLARAGGRPNPMRQAAAPAAAAVAAAPVALGKETLVKAPHIATTVSLAPVGKVVAVGDTVAVLRVLDEEIVLTATNAGEVVRAEAAAGALVEYDAPLVAVREAA